jgi:hypothetical protein
MPNNRKIKKNQGAVPNHLSNWRPIITPMKMARTKEIPMLETKPRVLNKLLFFSSIRHTLYPGERPMYKNPLIKYHIYRGDVNLKKQAKKLMVKVEGFP